MDKLDDAVVELIKKHLEQKEKFIIDEIVHLCKLGVLWIETDGMKISPMDDDTLSYFKYWNKPFNLSAIENFRLCFSGIEGLEKLQKENAQLKEKMHKMRNCENCFNLLDVDFDCNPCKSAGEMRDWEFNDE